MATVEVIDNNNNMKEGVVDIWDADPTTPCLPGVVKPGTKPASLL